MKLIITRPLEDAEILAGRLIAKGHQPICLPLLEIVPRKSVTIPQENWQAICLTSANGIRSLASIKGFEDCRILAVGQQSAVAARAKGFSHVETHGGDVKGLSRFISANLKPQSGPLLYISGQVTSGDMQSDLQQHGFTVHHLVTYDAVTAHPQNLATQISNAHGVLHYSPRSAELWLNASRDLSTNHLIHYCLSPNVALRLPETVAKKIAAAPDDESMMALLETEGKAA